LTRRWRIAHDVPLTVQAPKLFACDEFEISLWRCMQHCRGWHDQKSDATGEIFAKSKRSVLAIRGAGQFARLTEYQLAPPSFLQAA
jgi:hypothetical protein